MNYFWNATRYIPGRSVDWTFLYGIGRLGVLSGYDEEGSYSLWNLSGAYDVVPDIFKEKIVFGLIVTVVCSIFLLWVVFSAIHITNAIAKGFVRTIWSWIKFVVPYVFVWIAGELFRAYYMEDVHELYRRIRDK